MEQMDWWESKYYGYDSQGWYSSGQGWGTPITPKPKLEPKLQSQLEAGIMKFVANYSGNPFEMDMEGKTKALFTQGDGLWAMVDRPFAKILVQENSDHYPAQPVGFKSGFQLKLPKLPYKLFGQILSFFRYYVFDLDYKGVTEAMVWVYWDSNKNEYFIEVPKQEVTGGGVQYSNKLEDKNPRCGEKGVYKVFDIHSHNTMSTFFSGIDDRDEKGWQFYGVIGNIGEDNNKDNYKTNFRAGVDGYYHDCTYADLVEPVDNTVDISFPTEWCQNVSMPAPKIFEPVIVEPHGNRWWERDEKYLPDTSGHPYKVKKPKKVLFPKDWNQRHSSEKLDHKMRRIAGLAERIMVNFQNETPIAVQAYLDNNPDIFETLMDLQKAIDHMAVGVDIKDGF